MTPKAFNRLTEISQALKPKHQTGRTFHVTFVLDKSRIVSIGINNLNKTHPKTQRFDYKTFENSPTYMTSLHSEMDAWLKLGEQDCSHLTFVNVRINNNNELDLSYPCSGCLNLMSQIGFKEFYFSSKEKGFFKIDKYHNEKAL